MSTNEKRRYVEGESRRETNRQSLRDATTNREFRCNQAYFVLWSNSDSIESNVKRNLSLSPGDRPRD